MAADTELRMSTCDGDGVVKCGAGGHEGCGGERAGGGEFGDGAIDAAGEAEVVGVEDEAHRKGSRCAVRGSSGGRVGKVTTLAFTAPAEVLS